ncbi:apoptosis-associated speck-like protein containing a CARD [Pygocentrus nattereri]|uniref:apoptosis-associated speck-like protein containing a CARD n=1 Tax=Pygocentrus nattereri TaxID=42514 RepID=UPI0008145C2E|nr:apoptosis-associated speck-like protein containing a CARD [Pygocentrus nattereri]
MSKSARDVLLDGLEDLTEEQFKRFTDKLIDSRQEPRVRRGAVDKKDRLDVARIMIDTYTEKRALVVAVDLLKSIKLNQVAEDLEKDAAAIGLQLTPKADETTNAEAPFSEAKFIDAKSADLVSRATGVESILDVLLSRKVINNNQYSDISAEKTPQRMMSALIRGPIFAGGNPAKSVLYKVLMDQQSYMMKDLGAH